MNDKQKKKFGEGLSDKEIERIKQGRKVKEDKTTEDPNSNSFRLAALSDQDYIGFLKQLSSSERLVFTILMNKNKMDRNNRDIISGVTEQKFGVGVFQGELKTVDDLKADNIINLDIVYEGIESLRQVLTNLYFNHVGGVRLGDRKIYFGEEDFEKYVKKTMDILGERGLGLYDERQEKILKD